MSFIPFSALPFLLLSKANDKLNPSRRVCICCDRRNKETLQKAMKGYERPRKEIRCETREAGKVRRGKGKFTVRSEVGASSENKIRKCTKLRKWWKATEVQGASKIRAFIESCGEFRDIYSSIIFSINLSTATTLTILWHYLAFSPTSSPEHPIWSRSFFSTSFFHLCIPAWFAHAGRSVALRSRKSQTLGNDAAHPIPTTFCNGYIDSKYFIILTSLFITLIAWYSLQNSEQLGL